jgi:hypothetical protein
MPCDCNGQLRYLARSDPDPEARPGRAPMSEVSYGRCLCGAVRFEAKGKPSWVRCCHCESCRRHSGAPSNVVLSLENSAVTVTEGTITKVSSSPGVRRGFCARCGWTLTRASDRLPTEAHYCVGAFERAAALEPEGEFFAGERWPHLLKTECVRNARGCWRRRQPPPRGQIRRLARPPRRSTRRSTRPAPPERAFLGTSSSRGVGPNCHSAFALDLLRTGLIETIPRADRALQGFFR